MNRKDLLTLLSPFTVVHNLQDTSPCIDLPLRNLQWRWEDSKEDSVLFYKWNQQEKDLIGLRSRMEKNPAARNAVLILDLDERRTSEQHYSPIAQKLLNELRQYHSQYILVQANYFLEVQKILSDFFYPLNWDKNLIIGVTGTNGKTTTVNLARQIAQQLGHRAFSIGTLGTLDSEGRCVFNTGLTTPPYVELRKQFHSLFQNHEVCFMEVSSIALTSGRLYKIPFAAAAWMSFGQDHLDFHQNMSSYFAAKCRIFTHLLPKAPLWIPQEEQLLYQQVTQGWEQNIAKSASNIEKIEVIRKRSFDESILTSQLPPFLQVPFNHCNLQIALNLNASLWKFNISQLDFKQLQNVPGRFEVYQERGRIFVIDSAHTPDALEKICQGIAQVFPLARINILFGCGGDRDALKRPLMGKVALQFGHKIYVTSDNPRSEDPEQIAHQVCSGLNNENISIILDRSAAVLTACAELREGDALLLAGKGHEDYQIIGSIKYPYSDQLALMTSLQKLYGHSTSST